jgi:hypothetical protein
MLDWRQRMRAAGLRQRTIARLIGWTETGVSRGLRRSPPPGPISAVICAWEIMPPALRSDWLSAHGLRHRLPRQRLVSPQNPAKL